MQALGPFLMPLLLLGVVYFIMIRPMSRRQKEHQAMVNALTKGDEVITRGGVIGKISGVGDDGLVVLELQDKVRVRVQRSYIDGKWTGKVPATADVQSVVQ